MVEGSEIAKEYADTIKVLLKKVGGQRRPATGVVVAFVGMEILGPVSWPSATASNWRQALQEHPMQHFPHAGLLPVTQSPPAGHPRAQPFSGGSNSQGVPVRSTKTMLVNTA